MPAPFAAMEARTTAAVFKRLANAVATVGGVAVQGIFDSAYQLGDVGGSGMASTAPVLTLATSDVPASPVGTSVVVNALNYTVAAHEPDGTGISRLLLERTA
jgi:hypothetical protein